MYFKLIFLNTVIILNFNSDIINISCFCDFIKIYFYFPKILKFNVNLKIYYLDIN